MEQESSYNGNELEATKLAKTKPYDKQNLLKEEYDTYFPPSATTPTYQMYAQMPFYSKPRHEQWRVLHFLDHYICDRYFAIVLDTMF